MATLDLPAEVLLQCIRYLFDIKGNNLDAVYSSSNNIVKNQNVISHQLRFFRN